MSATALAVTSEEYAYEVQDDGTVDGYTITSVGGNLIVSEEAADVNKGEPTLASNINPFTDVASDAHYYTAVLWAVEQGITSGTSDTTFSPDETCTTAEVLTFLYRANSSPDATGEGEYYEDAVNWATTNSLADNVAPDSQSPRSDIVTYLYRNAGSPAV